MDNLGVLYISAGRISEANKLYRELHEKYGKYVEGKVHFVSILTLFQTGNIFIMTDNKINYSFNES